MNKLINKLLISQVVMEAERKWKEQMDFIDGQSQLVREPVLATSNQYYFTLGKFIKFLDNRIETESSNPFNEPGVREMLFQEYKVLDQRLWKKYKQFEKVVGYSLSASRSRVEPTFDLVLAQMALLIISGGPEDWHDAILLDRRGRVIDGASKLKACQALPDFPFLTVTLDYEHPSDENNGVLSRIGQG